MISTREIKKFQVLRGQSYNMHLVSAATVPLLTKWNLKFMRIRCNWTLSAYETYRNILERNTKFTYLFWHLKHVSPTQNFHVPIHLVRVSPIILGAIWGLPSAIRQHGLSSVTNCGYTRLVLSTAWPVTIGAPCQERMRYVTNELIGRRQGWINGGFNWDRLSLLVYLFIDSGVVLENFYVDIV